MRSFLKIEKGEKESSLSEVQEDKTKETFMILSCKNEGEWLELLIVYNQLCLRVIYILSLLSLQLLGYLDVLGGSTII